MKPSVLTTAGAVNPPFGASRLAMCKLLSQVQIWLPYSNIMSVYICLFVAEAAVSIELLLAVKFPANQRKTG